jgi:hypothetical protein
MSMLSAAKVTRSVVNGVLLVLPANTRGGGKGCVTSTVTTHQEFVNVLMAAVTDESALASFSANE